MQETTVGQYAGFVDSRLRYLRLTLATAGLLLIAVAAYAQQVTVLIEGPAGKVTTADIEADAQNIQSHIKDQALSNPAQVQRLAETIYVRRSLAAKAQQEGLVESGLNKVKLQQAQDAALSEIYLTNLKQQSSLDVKLAEQLARNEYNANKEKYTGPDEKRASHILIAGKTDAAKEKIEAIYQRLKQGADFAVLAQENSEDLGSAGRGGDLGFFSKGKMVPEFESALAALSEKGTYSQPFETQFGWHIVKFIDERKAGIRTFDEVKDALVNHVQSMEYAKARDELTSELRSQGVVNADAISAFAAQHKVLLPAVEK